MDSTSGPTFPKLKMNKRPDSQKLELLSLPENNGAMNIGFRNISYTVKEGLFRKRSRKLLDGVSGDFYGGELTALVGPSGAGKSILLNVLAGFTVAGTTGDKLVNEEIRNEVLFRRKSCYIMQNDNLQPLLTVEESMAVAASLNMTTKVKPEEKQIKVNNIMKTMDLWKNRKTRAQTLSGGEKRRLSIAMELLKDPQVMFFDEPTSGLDSLSSKQCIELLKQLAVMGRTVICSIHQPSATIFEMFDHLYILAKGKCLYQGSVSNLLPYLRELNFNCPTFHNPADYVIEVASMEHGGNLDDLTAKSENGCSHQWRTRVPFPGKFDNFRPTSVPSDYHPPLLLPKIANVKVTDCDTVEESFNQRCYGSYPTSFCNQLSVLLKRTALILSRDKTLTLSRFFTHTAIALFIGILYFGIGVDASNMLNNFNFLFFTVMFLMMTAFNCITTTFPSELPIITREHFNNWYSLKSYYLAISIADIPVQIVATLIYGLVTYFLTKQPMESYRLFLFLFMCILISLVAQSFGLLIGASMDIKNGVIFGPFCFLPFTIFSGFFVQLNDAPVHIRWIFHISYLKYGFEGLVLSVLSYDRGKFPCETDYCQFVYPEHFLEEMDMDSSHYSTAVIFLLCLTVVLRTCAFIALCLQIRYNRQHRR
ncbi:ATP-binding cassette sub-family G member 1 [Leptinotarsa decemlineata]|uniref:ATP-binding cassette sub-family G member 1 n=1 Tax=Leptinotarsa decemlineata TaxID=7539 RepID=UPI000C251F44|nr:ATP-binding cassette sub-family G member 1-like [Leptinotarsa decemlineata]